MDERIMAIDEAGFRKAMGHFASGVTVVTTEHEGKWFGMTVAAFSSLSLRPPLVLICIEKSAQTHGAIQSANRFAVHILSERQQEISNRFASRSEDKFVGLTTTIGKLKVPLLAGSLAIIECRLHESLPGGDHSIFIGEVIHAELTDDRPLLYFRSAYHRLNGKPDNQ